MTKTFMILYLRMQEKIENNFDTKTIFKKYQKLYGRILKMRDIFLISDYKDRFGRYSAKNL